MGDTPLLRADATDDDLQDEAEEEIPVPVPAGMEAYANEEGGWSYRPFYR